MSPVERSKVTASPKRIVVRGVNWLGDAVMTTPAMQRLREHFARAHIALMTPAKLADLWLHHPDVDEVIPLQPGDSPWKIGRKLRAGKFDLGLVFPNSPRSALEMFWGRVPWRVGYARGWRRWLLTHPVAARPEERRMRKRSDTEIRQLIRSHSDGQGEASALPRQAHHLFQYLHLLKSLAMCAEPAPPRVNVLPEEVARCRTAFLAAHPTELLWLGVNPGAEYGPAKRWPPERFAEAALRIGRARGCGVLLTGGPGDAALTGEVKARIGAQAPGFPVVDLAGRTTLRQLAGVMRCCRVFLSNDSGPMHLAAALGCRVVGVFGSTTPELTGPGLPGGAEEVSLIWKRPACAPCFLRECPIDFRCMNAVEIDEVVEVTQRLWGG